MIRLSELIALVEMDSSPALMANAAAGVIFPVVADLHSRSTESFGSLYDRFLKAFKEKKLEIYFDRFGRFTGYVLWEVVAAKDFGDVLNRSALDRDPNSAEYPIVLDFCAFYGEVHRILFDLRDRVFAKFVSCRFTRRKRGKDLCKTWVRSTHRTFFKSSMQIDGGGSHLLTWSGRDLLHRAKMALSQATKLGQCLELIRSIKRFAAQPSSAVVMQLQNPLSLGQAKLWLSSNGKPIAFMSWAWMTRAWLFQRDLPWLHDVPLSEWNEGECLCLCHAIADGEGRAILLSELTGGLFPGEDLYIYPREAEGIVPSQPPAHFPSEQRLGFSEEHWSTGAVQDVAEHLVRNNRWRTTASLVQSMSVGERCEKRSE
jgi:hemolysin-activating ACP:hemolysin acyltransferase